MFRKLLMSIKLFLMLNQLKRYKRDAEWYHTPTKIIPNWYDEEGIPNLEKKIMELKKKKK